MGEEIKFLARLVVRDGLNNSITPDKQMGLRYLIQVDVGEGRFFIDVTMIVLRTLNGNLPKSGEAWLDECNPKEDTPK